MLVFMLMLFQCVGILVLVVIDGVELVLINSRGEIKRATKQEKQGKEGKRENPRAAMDKPGKDDGGGGGKEERGARGRGKYDKETTNKKGEGRKEEMKGRATGRQATPERRTKTKQRSRSKTRSSERKTPERANSIRKTATSIAKSMLGLNAIEQEKVTNIKIKKEILETDHRYTAEKGGMEADEEEVQVVSTPFKRKKGDTGTPVQQIPEHEKKKKRQSHLNFTPVNQDTEETREARKKETEQKDEDKDKKREKENEANSTHKTEQQTKDRSSENQENQKPRETGTNTSNEQKNESKLEAENKTEAENQNKTNEKEEDEALEPPPDIQRATQEPIQNPYKTGAAIENQTTPKRTLSYAKAVDGEQTKLRTQEKKRGKYNRRFEITFSVDEKEITEAKEVQHLREALTAILKRAKKVDKNAMINTWQEHRQMRTIKEIEDIPFTPADMKQYLNHPFNDRRIRKKNSGWRINMALSIPHETFIHFWELSRHEHREIQYVSIKDAPIQSERHYYVGSFLNSSEGQISELLNLKLQEETQVPINLAYRNAPLDKKSQDRFWRDAYNRNNQGEGPIWQFAPLALTVYSDTAENSRMAAKYLMEKYGSQDGEGQYPRMPDGTRMRFIPAARFLDMAGKSTAEKLFANQIKFNVQQIKLALPITRIYQRHEEHGDKTTMELLLAMRCEDKGNEPYFRHLTKRWTREIDKKKYWVSVHKEMYEPAMEIMKNLKFELHSRYGEKVSDLVEEPEATKNTGKPRKIETKSTIKSNTSESTLTIDTNDRYLNGHARFIIEGMEKLHTNESEPTLAEQRAQENNNYEMEVASKGTDNTMESIVPRHNEPPDPNNDQNNDTPKTQPKSVTQDSWTRVGDEADEQRLHQYIKKTTPTKPGVAPGQQTK